jgi:hypothetical protein
MTNTFQQLKIAIAQTYCSRFPDCQTPLQDWKGKEIRRFQQDLSERVQGQISEKSFYTYFKSEETDKLPRVDVLNLLSAYVGVSDWAAFVAQYPQVEPATNQAEIIADIDPVAALADSPATVATAAISPASKSPNKRWYLASIVLVLLLVFGWGIGNAAQNTKREPISCTFCFVDADNKAAIRNKQIVLQMLKTDESPQLIYVDTLTACAQIRGEVGEKIRFVASAPYYHKDTISRTLANNLSREMIALRMDDYALMLHYISKTDLKDWQHRRKQLDDFLADEVQVVQIYGSEADGIAIYNKAEFIDKLTMPIETLKDIDIIQTDYNSKGQAIYIRFR